MTDAETEQDPFKNAMMFWKMCPHHYTNEDLYQAFKSRLINEGVGMEELRP